ncbi:MAG: EAL domain-containing protein [Pseudorhodoplanes sp.]|jgi:diguanylate cyclase (GGDEF)-like protein/PAS domain S-box-containing protein|nr:EAL domain-containing protein [Pseudorhodoplanes sp.]
MLALVKRMTFRNLIASALGLVGLGVVAIGLTVWALRSDVLREAYVETSNIATILAQQTARSVRSVDLIATDIQERFSRDEQIDDATRNNDMRSEATWNFLVERQARLVHLDVVALVDKYGKVANTVRQWPAPDIDLSDRDYFKYHQNNSSSELHVSSTLVNRLTGDRTVFMTKRIHGPGGEFLGVVLLGLKLSYFQHIYNSITSTRSQTLLFLRRDGTVIVRHPDIQGMTGRRIPAGSDWYRVISEGGGSYRSEGHFDGIARLVATKPVQGFPLAINVAISEHDALANWRHRAMLIGIGTALAVLCSLLLLSALNKQYRRLLRSEESLAERESRLAEKTNELQAANRRIDSALNNMLQGLAMFDADTRMVICNRPYIEMYGLSAAIVREGVTLRTIIEHRIKTGTFFGNIEDYLGQVMRMLATGEPMVTFTELPDGRTFCLTNKPTGDGGWVATHQDVTVQRRAEKELQRTRNFLNIVVENVPETLVVKNAKDGRYILANRASERFYDVPRDEIIGKTAFDILPEEVATVVAARDREALERGRLTVEDYSIYTPKSGHRFVTSKRAAIPSADGTPEFLLTILEDVTERKRGEQRIIHLAHHDPLTDLPNRAAFNAKLTEAIESAKARGEKFALLCTDLDRFKEVNDLFGHAAGDTVLLEISRRLKIIAGDAFLSRLGGDEFPIVVSGMQPDAAKQMAHRLIAAMTEEIDYEGRQFRPGISIGIAIYPDDGADVATLLRNADAALYRAKSEGRGIVRFYEAEMDRLLRDRRALQNNLAVAAEKHELMLYYQPQARVTGQIVGFEVLLRWNHPARGFVPPDTFIPLAEENGMIVPIGEWVLREGCREAASWPKPLQIAINLSPVQFRHGDLVGLVHSVLLETGLAPERLVLEITEGALMDDYSHAVSILRRLKALGVQIAMDDFGTGYSSLSYLQSFPFDKIKIDQTFISNMERNNQSAAIVRAVLGLGQKLNLLVVAEGVENQEQLAILRHERCDEMQGYLIGRPGPISEYPEMVGRKPLEEKRIGAR